MRKFFAILMTFVLGVSAFAYDMALVQGGKVRGGNFDGCTISSFYIGKYKVDAYDYSALMNGYLPCNYSFLDLWEKPMPVSEWHSIPAAGVSWCNAIIYCNRLSEQEGLTPCYASKGSKDKVTYSRIFDPFGENGFLEDVTCDWNANGYRLPTDAEWEFASRSGTKQETLLYSGSEIQENAVNENKPYKLGLKKPNRLGLYDMCSTRIYEWCWDYFADDTSAFENSKNPKGPNKPNHEKERVVRGFNIFDRIGKDEDEGITLYVLAMSIRLVRNAE